MEESKKKVSCKSIIKSLFNLQLGNADQTLFSYHSTLNSLLKLKPTKGLPNDPTIANSQISEIHFNNKGNLLANSYWVEDKIQIWDWYQGTLKNIVPTGHDFTVMHFNWVPCGDDNLLVTSGQQGDVRLTNLTTNDSRLLLESHERGVSTNGYRFSVNENLPHTILAGDHNGKIVLIDVREENPTDLCVIKDNKKKYEISSLDINPVKCSEFCVGGRNNVRIYDHRNASKPIQEFNLLESYCYNENSESKYRIVVQNITTISAVKYNFNGTRVLVNSNSDPIYLLDTTKQNAPKKFAVVRSQRQSYNIYDAHFCGQRSEFIITISSINEEFQRTHTVYIWDQDTQELIHEIELTENSWRFAVHPSLPVLAMNWDHQGIRLWQ